MRDHCFGRKLKLPSTIAIKHQLLTMMFEEEIRAIPPGGLFKKRISNARHVATAQSAEWGNECGAPQSRGGVDMPILTTEEQRLAPSVEDLQEMDRYGIVRVPADILHELSGRARPGDA